MKILFKLAITRRAVFSSKCTQNRLSAWLRPDPLRELTALPRLPNWISGGLLLRKGRERVGRGLVGREGNGRAGKGRRSGLPLHIISGYATAVMEVQRHNALNQRCFCLQRPKTDAIFLSLAKCRLCTINESNNRLCTSVYE